MAQTITVGPDAEDYPTIGQAVTAAALIPPTSANLVTILVSADTYAEMVDMSALTYTSLVGVDRDTCRIVPGAGEYTVKMGSWCNISNLSAINTTATSTGVIACNTKTDISVSNCYISGPVWAVHTTSCARVLVTDCLMAAPQMLFAQYTDQADMYRCNNAYSGASVLCFGMVDLFASYNCHIQDNAMVATSTNAASDSYGIRVEQGDNWFTNNHIDMTAANTNITGIDQVGFFITPAVPTGTNTFVGNKIKLYTTSLSAGTLRNVKYDARYTSAGDACALGLYLQQNTIDLTATTAPSTTWAVDFVSEAENDAAGCTFTSDWQSIGNHDYTVDTPPAAMTVYWKTVGSPLTRSRRGMVGAGHQRG